MNTVLIVLCYVVLWVLLSLAWKTIARKENCVGNEMFLLLFWPVTLPIMLLMSLSIYFMKK